MSGRPAGSALLLVDVQRDFFGRAGLVPHACAVSARAAVLLEGLRAAAVPVAHAQTRIRPDGSDRMPHWKRAGLLVCVDGTPGAEPPAPLAPRDGEPVFRKTHYSAFGDPGLEAWLRERSVTHLVLAGLYLHACVRSTALDAYERGFEVTIVEDAVGSTEPMHAEATRAWLEGRVATFTPVAAVLARLGAGGETAPAEASLPIALVAGRREAGPRGGARLVHRDPARSAAVVSEIPVAGTIEVAAASAAAAAAQPDWAAADPAERAGWLERFAEELESRRAALRDLVVRETGKPVRFVEEELGRALAHVRGAAALGRGLADRTLATGVRVALRPVGVVGLVTPWNNPVAIPVGKIAPALAFGNAVVWKPAPEASRTALAVLDALSSAGFPAGLVAAVLGDAGTARAVAADPRVAAVSITGSIEAGRAIAAVATAGMKPVQAELGGNNAAIVLADADLAATAADLARGAFGFAGQRCTAIRRLIVERAVETRFEACFVEAMVALRVGEPADPETEIGPLVSAARRARVTQEIDTALADGARVVAGGGVPRGFEHGAWLTPVLLAGAAPGSRIVQRESFGPVVLLQPADDLDQALALANGVPHGLVLAVATASEAAVARVLERGEAGIVHAGGGPLAIHPEAPFLGWKASGFGPPEHGEWDLHFYTRAQARYRKPTC